MACSVKPMKPGAVADKVREEETRERGSLCVTEAAVNVATAAARLRQLPWQQCMLN